jgi:hypothetical protein
MRRRLPAWILPPLLFLALYARTLDYGFVWVDQAEIVGGSILRPPGRIAAAFAEPLHAVGSAATRPFGQPYYRPLQVVVASRLDAAFGRAPRTFRALSLTLGAVTAALVVLLARSLRLGAGAAALCGAVFAVHPLNLEVYVWVSGLASALLGVCLLVGLLAGGRALRGSRVRPVWAAGSLVALALALLAKESAVVAPALQLALAAGAATDARRRGEPAPAWHAVAVLVALQTALVAGYLLVLRPVVLGAAIPAAAPIGGSLPTQWTSSIASWPAALGWLFAPLRSSTSDALRVVTSWADPAVLAGLALAAGSGLAWIWWLRRGEGAAAAALAWLWLAFLPTSGLVPLLHARAERNLFPAVIGAALLWASAGTALRRRGVSAALGAALGALLVSGLAQRSWARTPAWRSTIDLFGGDVAADPRHREGRLNLAVAYLLAGRPELAKHHADALAAQRPEAEGWHSYAIEQNLRRLVCTVNAVAGRDADTLRAYPLEPLPAAAEISREPGFRACQAEAAERSGRFAPALALYAELARSSGPDAGAAFALGAGRCALALGRPDEARRWLATVPEETARARGLAPALEQLRSELARAPSSGSGSR